MQESKESNAWPADFEIGRDSGWRSCSISEDLIWDFNITHESQKRPKFYAVDIARCERNNVYYGVGTDMAKNLIYYFDMNNRHKYFGMDSDTNARALGVVGRVAATKSGRFYCVDANSDVIYYWDIDGDTFQPEGRIDFKFEHIGDIYADENDDIYIVDNIKFRIYKYSTKENRFLTFGTSGKPFLNYGRIQGVGWGLVRGIEIYGQDIFLVGEAGMIIKMNQECEIKKAYKIAPSNLGLFPRSGKEESQCWLESITLDRFGNVYVLDTQNQSIHMFSNGLKYFGSWSDPAHPIGTDARDICIAPGRDFLFIAHPWGFYTYRQAPRLTGIMMDGPMIFPDIVDDRYKGVGMDVSIIGSGNLSITITGIPSL